MESEALNRLEDKVRRAADLIAELRRENQRLARELESARSAPDPEARTKGQGKLGEQVRLLREERAQVRARVERLVGLLEESA